MNISGSEDMSSEGSAGSGRVELHDTSPDGHAKYALTST